MQRFHDVWAYAKEHSSEHSMGYLSWCFTYVQFWMDRSVDRSPDTLVKTRMTKRISRDEAGMELAAVWAQRGTCARRRVGCVLMDVEGHVLSSGYNGPASGQPHCVDHPCPGAGRASGTGLDECEALHAEWNAIARCPDIARIHACYVSSSPCVTCVKMLMNTGCRRIVFGERYAHDGAAERLWVASGQHRTPERSWEQFT